MAIRSDDISQIIKSAIDEFDASVETRSVGTVVEVGDGIARIYGLEGALASELLEFPGGVKGMARNLEEGSSAGEALSGNASSVWLLASGQSPSASSRSLDSFQRCTKLWCTSVADGPRTST